MSIQTGGDTTDAGAVLRVLVDCGGWVTWPMLFAAVGHEVPQTRARDALLRLHALGAVERRDRGSEDGTRDPAYRLRQLQV